MALTGIDLSRTEKYISERDPDKENPTVFHLRMINPIVRTFIDDQSVSFSRSGKGENASADAKLLFGTKKLLTVKFGLENIENFIDPQTGKEIAFKTVSQPVSKRNYNIVSDEVLAYFSDDLIEELADAISKHNELSEAEVKN